MAKGQQKLLCYASKVVPRDEIANIEQQMKEGIDMETSEDIRSEIQNGVQYVCTLGIYDDIDHEQVTKPITLLRFGSETVR